MFLYCHGHILQFNLHKLPFVIIIPQLKQFLFILVKATDLLFHRDWLGQSPTRRCFTQPVTTQPRQFFGRPKNIYFSIFITIWPMPMKNARCFFFISFVFWTNMFWHVFYMSCIINPSSMLPTYRIILSFRSNSPAS